MFRNLALVFDDLKVFHLEKDVGVVPALLAKEFNANLMFVTNASSDSELESAVTSLGATLVRYPRALPLWWICKHARSIDFLVLFHLNSKSVWRALVFKLSNPNGFIYLKSDLASPDFQYATVTSNFNWITGVKRWILSRLFRRIVGIVSVECEKSFLLQTLFPKSKIFHLPNGVLLSATQKVGAPDMQSVTKNVLMVSRHGAPEKNSEVLFDLLPLLPSKLLEDVRFQLVGPATETFLRRLDDFRVRYPNLSEHIVYLGMISDRRLLFSYYQSASVFFLPSLKDSFPLAISESLFFGCALVVSGHLTCAFDFIDIGSCGIKIDPSSPQDIAEKMSSLLQDKHLIEDYASHSILFANNRLVWELQVNKLSKRIIELCSAGAS